MKKVSKVLVLLLVVGLCLSCFAGCNSEAKKEEAYANELTTIANDLTDDFNNLSTEITNFDPNNADSLNKLIEIAENGKANCNKLKALDAPKSCEATQAKLNDASDKFIEGLDILIDVAKNPTASDVYSKFSKVSTLFSEGSSLLNEAADLLPQD